MIEISFTCKGHENISALHSSTLEITTEKSITPKGDCIVGVSSSLSLHGLPPELKTAIKQNGCKVRVILTVADMVEEIVGYGSSQLLLSSKEAMIIRKSSYICGKTLLVNANKSAIDLSRKLIKEIQKSDSILTVKIQVENG